MPDENNTSTPVEQPGQQPGQQPPADPGSTPDSGAKKGGDTNLPVWLPERLKEEAKLERNRMLRELGFEKMDDLKTFFEDAKKLKESQMTEDEKTKAALAEAQKKAEEATRRATELEAARIADRIDSAIATTAKDSRAEHPEDVIDWIRKSGEDLSKLVDESGKVNATAVKALVDKAKAARPGWFLSGGPGSPSNRKGNVPEPDADTKKLAKQELRKSIRRMT